MVNEYEFKELNRDLASLEKRYNKFQTQAESDLNKIINLKFNKQEYGSDVIEKRIKRMVKDCTNQIERYYSSFINEVRRKAYSVREEVKSKAREINSQVSSYNSEIDNFNKINSLFANKKFDEVIAKADSMRSDYQVDTNEYNYILFLELESLDFICKQRLNNSSISDELMFKKYDYLCKNHNAIKHLYNAKAMYAKFAATLLSKENDLSLEEKYNIAIRGLQNIIDINGNAKDKEILYLITKNSFNELSKKAYDTFDYANAKKYLKESIILDVNDINIDFYKTRINIEEALFNFCVEKHSYASQENIKLAIHDTIQLSHNNSKYFDFWIGSYDSLPSSTITYLLKEYEAKYNSENFKSYIEIYHSIYDNYAFLQNKGNLIKELNDYYQVKVIDKINLISFIEFEIYFIKLIKSSGNVKDTTQKELLDSIYDINARKTYPLIKKYFIELCAFKNLSFLNDIYKEISNYLIGKDPKKLLDNSLSKISEKELEKFFVKPINFDKKIKTKKGLVIGGIVVGIILIAAIILVIMFSK